MYCKMRCTVCDWIGNMTVCSKSELQRLRHDLTKDLIRFPGDAKQAPRGGKIKLILNIRKQTPTEPPRRCAD